MSGCGTWEMARRVIPGISFEARRFNVDVIGNGFFKGDALGDYDLGSDRSGL